MIRLDSASTLETILIEAVFVNIGLIPLLLCVLLGISVFLVWHAYRRQTRNTPPEKSVEPSDEAGEDRRE